ncbi:MAG: carboxypeptidase regulatory-like domain-containing protein [Phaeodactylibacter sp.]|nr:carboxypeptidase regulatory-like domain-containing protein [Phaeodactylibacter sp.]
MKTTTPFRPLFLFWILAALLPLTVCAQGQADLHLSFTIKDIDSGSPITGANIYVFDENNKFIFEGSSNLVGVFTIPTKLRPGQKIRVMIQKEGYKVFTKDFEITDPGRQENKFEIKLIPKRETDEGGVPISPGGDYGNPLSGHIYDSRSLRSNSTLPLRGVKIDLLVDGRRIFKGQTDSRGYFIIYHDFVPGKPVVLFLDKSPEYQSREYHYTYQEYGNVLSNIYLDKRRKVPCKCWFWTAGTAVAGASYLLPFREYQKLDERYRDLDNLDVNYNSEQERQDDLDKAGFNKGLGIGGMVAGGAAIIAGPFLCKWLSPKLDAGSVNEGRLRPGFFGYGINGVTPGLTLAYTF